MRAFTPWPSAYTKLGGKLLKVHRAAVVDAAPRSEPGTVVNARGDLDVATGAGLLRLLEVQLEGKRRLRAREFLAGQPLQTGDELG